MTPGRWLGLLVLAGAALRFATLDLQSLWYDEAVTAHLVQMDLGAMLRAIPGSESTPPLYYVLAWLAAQLAGTGEAALRVLPALCGVATIAVVWAIARRLGGDRAALYAAALTAVNPMLVWFSQEARAYALLALLAACSALLWLRALESPRTGRLLAWGAVAALALATHYYALFLVGPQAVWLALRVHGRRAIVTTLALPVAATIALAPLAIAQRSNDSAAFIGESPLLRRLAQVPKQFLVGYDAPLERLLAVATAVALLAGVVGLLRLLPRRGEVLALTVVTAAALLIPVALALLGEDHLVTRNVLAALPLALALAGAGLAALPGTTAARLAAATACALGLVAVIGVDTDQAYQRDDWRGAARAMGAAGGDRVVVAAPGSLPPLRYYLPGLRPLAAPLTPTAEVDYVLLAPRRGGGRVTPPRAPEDPIPGPGFTVRATYDTAAFTVIRMRAPTPQILLPGNLVTNLDGTAGEPLQQPGGRPAGQR